MQLVIQNQCKGPGNDCVALTTKLEVFSHASHHVLSVRSLLFNKHSYPTNDVTRCAESAIYILHIFAYNFGTR
jgi:hypothetical protein